MIDCIGIGNALLDMEYQISNDILAKTALTKGSMSLADIDTQNALLQTLKKANQHAKTITGGGSAANSLACFTALGGSAFYNCKVGNDGLGVAYLDDLAKFGVISDSHFATQSTEQPSEQNAPTGTCVALISDDGERTMQTHLGASASLGYQNVDFDRLSTAKWLYLEGYLAMSDNALSIITRLRQQAGVHGVKIALSFADPAVPTFAKTGLLTMLGNGVDMIFCNLQEAQIFTDKKQHKSCVKALTDYAPLVVVTNGSQPTLVGQIIDNQCVISQIDSTPCQVLDTTGAGDSFAGAFLYGINEYYPIHKCGELASKIASKVVSQYGARLAKDDYLTIKREVLG